MKNFTIRTDNVNTSQDNIELPSYDAYFMIYCKGDNINFSADYAEGHDDKLATLIMALTHEDMKLDIIDSLPEIVDDGDLIAEELIDKIGFFDDFEEMMEETAIIQPADMYTSHNKESH